MRSKDKRLIYENWLHRQLNQECMDIATEIYEETVELCNWMASRNWSDSWNMGFIRDIRKMNTECYEKETLRHGTCDIGAKKDWLKKGNANGEKICAGTQN